MNKFINIHVAKEFVRERADLLRIIQEDIGDREWKQEGSNTWVTTSPFREEINPSFKVSGVKFRDWGGEQHSGDVFTWVQIWHGVRFDEAIVQVANRCNINIQQYLAQLTAEDLLHNRYKQINQIAAEYMHQLLKDNSVVRNNYLSRSGFTWDMIEPYMVGYCPSSEVLIGYVSSQIRLTEDDVFKLELNRNDLFNDVLVYPIHNSSGDILSFRTRKLNPEKSPYIGVRSEHPLHDPNVLYGMHVARKNIRKNNSKLVIVEGQRDAIALRAAAVMGSSLREKQIEELKRHKIKQLVICYDGDETGWKKTLELVNDPPDFGDMLVLIARPNWVTSDLDVDPHDIWRLGGDTAIYAMLNKAMLPIEYYINENYGTAGALTLTDKNKLLTDLKDYMSNLSGTRLDMSAAYIAKYLESTQENVLEYINEIKAGKTNLFNLEAERVLIYYCMSSAMSYSATYAAGVRAQAFTLSAYYKLYGACEIAYKRFADKYTAQAVLDEAMAKYPSTELQTIVNTVMDGNYKYSETAACEIVLDLYRRRQAASQAYKLVTASKNLATPFVEVINEHRRVLIESVSSSKQQARTPQELSQEFHTILKQREQSGGNLIIGHSFHTLPSINMILGGIQSGHDTIIAGDTGAGKSAFGVNILKCLAIDGNVPCLWVGQEMQSFENTARLVSMMTGINNTHLQAGKLTQKQAITVADAMNKIASSGYYFAKPRDGSIDEIVALVDEYRFKYGIQVVFWDYIQLVLKSPSQSRMSREEVIGHASKIVKSKFTEDMKLSAIIIAQLNRSENNSKVTQRIGGSYQISQDCDNFIEIIEKTEKQMNDDGRHNGNRYIKIGKRRGGISNFMINAQLDTEKGSATLRLKELTQPSEQAELYAQLAS